MASTLLLVIVFVLDLIAFALAVAAEQRRSTDQRTREVIGTGNLKDGLYYLREEASIAAISVEDTLKLWHRRLGHPSEKASLVNTGTEAYCKYDSDVSTGLGIGAFLLLLCSQLLVMLTSRCLCCGRGLRPGGSRTWAIVLFVSCWVLFLIAEACLLAGSVTNAYHTKYRSVLNSPPSCQTLRKGVFAAGAAFTVFTGIISELYYVSYSKASVDCIPKHPGDTGLRMGNL